MPLPATFDPTLPCPVSFNIAEYVLTSAGAPNTKAALKVLGAHGQEIWTYAQLRDAVASYAAALSALELAPGSKVLMRLGNTVEFPLVFLACVATNLVPVPTSAALTTAEVDWIVSDLAPALCILDQGVDGPSGFACLTLDDLRMSLTSAAFAPILGDPNRLAYVIYTSGSSGTPRAVAHAHRAIWARRMMWRGWYGIGPEDQVMHAGAFNWTYTLGVGLLDPWAVGATAIVPEPGTATSDLATCIDQSGATIFAATPGVYRQILKSPSLPKMTNLRHGLSAGEALPGAVRDAWTRRTGTELYEALGMSECSTFVSARPGRQAPEGASGYPQPGRRIAALNADGRPVEPDTPGSLGIHRGDPGLMLGYLTAGRAHLPLTGDWFATGDMVSFDPDGAVRYLGRSDDMMNAGGFRVSPLEVERAFLAQPGVAEAAAVEVQVRPDVTVIALFYTGPDPLDENLLLRAATQHLARYKQPRLYIYRQTLPKGGNGKLNRRVLRDAYEACHDQA